MPIPTTSPALIVDKSIVSSVSSTIAGTPYDSGVAAASTYSQRGVMTPIPNDTWLGFTRWTVTCLASRKIDESPSGICVYQFDAYTIADLETFVAPFETSLDQRTPDPNPGALFGRARHDGIKTFSDP